MILDSTKQEPSTGIRTESFAHPDRPSFPGTAVRLAEANATLLMEPTKVET